jgi:hypothetical protein
MTNLLLSIAVLLLGTGFPRPNAAHGGSQDPGADAPCPLADPEEAYHDLAARAYHGRIVVGNDLEMITIIGNDNVSYN